MLESLIVTLFDKKFLEEKRRRYDQLGRAGYRNGGSSSSGYGGFSPSYDFNQEFNFHDPFEIFRQFMSNFGMNDDFGESNLIETKSTRKESTTRPNFLLSFRLPSTNIFLSEIESKFRNAPLIVEPNEY